MKFNEVLEEAKKEYDSSKPITHTLINGGKIHIPKNLLNSFNKKLLKACIDNNENHLLVEKLDGMNFNLLTNKWSVAPDTSINYIIKLKKN